MSGKADTSNRSAHVGSRTEKPASNVYEALNVNTIGSRLGELEAMVTHLGSDTRTWQASEVGDGNLNLVFIVKSAHGAVVVKQALPYVRLVGDSWPLPLSRSFFEYHALTRQAARSPGDVPLIFHFDEQQALIIMEYLSPHRILRHSLMEGIEHQRLGETLGVYCANTLFRGSDLSLPTAERKADVGLFADNVALCDITENLVFDDPYRDAPMNGEIPGSLQASVDEMRADTNLKVEVQHLKRAFCNHAETMLHGDLHTGSVMVHEDDARVIDPEFALYGPMGLDLGMLLANFFMAWFAQPGHATSSDDRTAYRDWIMSTIEATWSSFAQRFRELWQVERNGILYPASLYESGGDSKASNLACDDFIRHVWQDTLGFAGVEIHRRTIGLARIVEYESIEDVELRSRLQAKGLQFGRALILQRTTLDDMNAVLNELRRHASGKST